MEEKISLGDYQKLLNTAIDLGHFLLEAGAELIGWRSPFRGCCMPMGLNM